MPDIADIVELERMRVFSLSAALVVCSATFFSQSPVDARTALALIHDTQDILRRLLTGDHGAVAGRLAGAFRGHGPDADGVRHRRSHACGRIHRAWERPVRGSCREFSPSTDVGAEVVGGGFIDVLSPATFRNRNGSAC